MAVKEYVVTGGGLVARQGTDGKKSKRFKRGEKAKLDDRHMNVDRLVALKAIAPADEDAKPSSTWEQAQAANRYNQSSRAGLVDFGRVAQAEDDQIRAQLLAAGGDDDGGQGSSPTPPPGAPGNTAPPPAPPAGSQGAQGQGGTPSKSK